jgi:hypothetical protein
VKELKKKERGFFFLSFGGFQSLSLFFMTRTGQTVLFRKTEKKIVTPSLIPSWRKVRDVPLVSFLLLLFPPFFLGLDVHKQ